MYLPQFQNMSRKSRKQTVQFGGVNYTQNYQDGELAASKGVSCRDWPCLTNRAGHTKVQAMSQGSGLFAWDKLVAVDGTSLLYDGQVVGTLTAGKKQMAVVHTKLCIFPDKKYLDLSTREMGDLQAQVVNPKGLMVTFTEKSVTLAPDDQLGRFTDQEFSLRPAESWVRSHGRAKGEIQSIQVFDALDWDDSEGRWVQGVETAQDVRLPLRVIGLVGKKVLLRDTGIAGGYALNVRIYDEVAYLDGNRIGRSFSVREDYGPYDLTGVYGVITAVEDRDLSADYSYDWIAARHTITVEVHNAARSNPGLEDIFFPGDRVTISGCETLMGNEREKIQVETVEGTTLTFVLNDENKFTPGTETGAVTLCREVPDLSYICESGGRLWGVSNADGQIYASALGDPRNFYAYIDAYSGATQDGSWGAEVGTPGPWTGITAYGSDVLCWKENVLHKVLGNLPGNYEVFDYQICGVQAGSEKSIQIVNEALYYKGRGGVYVYTGSTPQLVSGKLGAVEYGEAVAGQDGRNYVVAMKRLDTGEWETLSYSLETGLWMVRDAGEVADFANLDGRLYFMTGDGVFRQEGETDDGEAIAWEATFVPFAEALHSKKGFSRILFYLELGQGAWAEIDVKADQGLWRTVWTAKAGDARAVSVPIRPGRCNVFQVRLRGAGTFQLKSMVREFFEGGDRR